MSAEVLSARLEACKPWAISAERRVGKEGLLRRRYRWSPYHSKGNELVDFDALVVDWQAAPGIFDPDAGTCAPENVGIVRRM